MLCLPTFIESAISVTYCIRVTDDVMICFFITIVEFFFNGKIFSISIFRIKIMPNTKYEYYDIYTLYLALNKKNTHPASL